MNNEIFSSFWKATPAREQLLPFPQRSHAYPKAGSPAWAALPPQKQATIRSWSQEVAASGYPLLPATAFMAFVRTGDRLAYETPYFARRQKLIGAALGECLHHDPLMLDTVVDGLWCICEESFWGISAHNDVSHEHLPAGEKRPLPNPDAPYIDLFAAQTGCTLALTLHLLGEQLDEVTPLLRRRVMAELEKRIFTPFLTRDDFWWMGITRHDLCNWTPWIVSSVLLAAEAVMEDNARLGLLMERASAMLDRYLLCVPEDGGCDEGAGYWNMAGGALLDCMEVFRRLTGGKAQVYDNPKIRNIGLFPLRSHLAGAWFMNFADCDAKPLLDGERLYTYGQRIGSEALSQLGAFIGASIIPQDTPQMNRVLDGLFTDMPPAESPAAGDVNLDELQVWVRRRGDLTIALKGGHNAESHNHNDVGSFLIYCGGEPVIVDAGNLVYTAKTFSSARYTLWNTRSCNHNVPLIGTCEQAAGREHAARQVQADADCVSMDISAAYPAEAGVRKLLRQFDFGASSLSITDEIELTHPQPITWVLMFRARPEMGQGSLTSGPLTVSYPNEWQAQVEEISVTDARMRRSFPGSLWRVALCAPAASHCLATLRFSRT